MRRVRVVIRGRVQGVFYRTTCAAEARRRSVAGWVRNLPDGTVEAVFEGASTQVEGLIEWCRSGPPGARVDSVHTSDEEPLGASGFRVSG